MSRTTMILAPAGLTIAALLATGCAASHSAGAQAVASAHSSLIANPAYQQDKTRLENELLANLKKDFNPQHPVTSSENAVRDTFPQGDSTAIVNYGLKTFTGSAGYPGSAQPAWGQGVVIFALDHGAGAGLPSPGTASLPAGSAP